MHVEGAQRIRVVRGREDHRHRAAQQLEHLEAVELRHLHVEEHQVGGQLRDRLHRVEPIAAFGDDRDAGVSAEILAHHRARQRLVVDDDDAKRIDVAHAGSVVAGNDSSIRQTPPCSLLLTMASAP